MNNYRIFFVNENRAMDVPQGISILDAQILAGIHPDAPCGGRGSCGKCLAEIRENPSEAWKTCLACQHRICHSLEVRTSTPAAEMKIMADEDIGAAWDPWVRLPASFEGKAYMAAVDIGTTTIAAYLIGLKERRVMAVASMLNPQIQFGADVIARANYTIEHGIAEPMRSVRKAVDDLIGQMCAELGAPRERVFAVSMVGNSCMHHLFLGYALHTLVRAPYVPLACEAMVLRAEEYGLNVHPDAQLLVQPLIAGFVGADTVACLVSENWQETKRCTLLIDIGTNGEMALGNAKRRMACSTAAGPALEGAKIQCGMRGGDGAIDHVWLEDGSLRWHVIGDGAAKGICGSGIVDLIAMLLESGEIDESGKLQGKDRVFIGDTNVMLTQKDIREVQLAKAAIAAGIRLLAKKMDVSLAEIEEVQIAGAFGNYMNPDSACKIGLIPMELRDKIRVIGNAAGKGAQRVLTDRQAWKYAIQIANTTGFLELAGMPEFQDVFVDELGFPEVEQC